MTELGEKGILAELEYQKRKVKQLEEQLYLKSWETNPDRSGGQFTREEIDRARGGWY